MSYLPIDKELDVLRNTAISMKIDAENQSLAEWQKSARSKLSELIGLDSFKKCDEDFKIEFTQENDDYTEYRILFQSEENYYVPCHLRIPKKSASSKPAVMICLQGHSTGMHISLGNPKFDGDAENINSGDRNFAVQSIEKGLAALTIEQRCFGERGGKPRPDCHSASMTALLCGRTVVGTRVWDVMRAIDMVTLHFSDKINTKKIFCMGNSGGGTTTFYVSALEPRIVASMPSCAFCTFEDSIGNKHHCECNYVPSIRKYFDMAEIAGMIAPRPLVIVSGKTDGIFPADTAAEEFRRVKKEYYEHSSNPENCVHVIGNEGHRFYADLAWPEFFARVKI